MAVSSERVLDNLVDTQHGTLNNAIFSHPDIYAQEIEQIFNRMWLLVGHESQIPRPGDFIRSRMGEEQVIVTRAPDRRVHVLLNSCAHRGNVVCRYDRGSSLSFQCSFHGWVYNHEGALTKVPDGMADAYEGALRMEEWGLLRARAETFHGTIWATWDDSAPSLLEYFGGAEAYLAAALSDAEGDPEGTEVVGGIMKWRVGLNWKVPMPDNDVSHGWITHHSRTRGDGAAGFTQGTPNYQNSYHIWFPEGHNTSLRVQDDGAPGRSFGAADPSLQEYLDSNWEKRWKRLGKLAYVNEPPHIFPNMGAVGRIFRVLHPRGPTETEMWSWIIVDKNMPAEVKRAIVREHERQEGPNGMTQKDDMENWYILTQYSKGTMTRTRLRQNAQLGMLKPSLHGPSTFGMPGMFHPSPTDENIRRFYQRWAQCMDARDWDEMRITDHAK